MMDHTEVRKHRTDLGLSQAALARATGINRTVLSGFETGQLSLKGDMARRLEDYFAHRGIERVERQPAEPVKPEARAVSPASVVRGPAPSPAQQALLNELRWVEAQLDAIECADCTKGFVGLFLEQGEKERERLLVFLARWRVLKRALKGEIEANRPIPKTPVTQADFMARAYQKLRQSLDREAR